jgi:protein ImuA
VLWCLAQGDLYGPGLALCGLDPGRVVLAAVRRDDDILWAMEEGLRMPGLAAVVGEIGHLPMVASRRLQLAAEHSGVTAFVLRRWRNSDTAAAERSRPSVAATRWRVAALPAADIAGEPGIGRPRWRVELLRCRGAVPASWKVEVADATGLVSVSAELADRSAPHRVADTPSAARRAG